MLDEIVLARGGSFNQADEHNGCKIPEAEPLVSQVRRSWNLQNHGSKG